MTLTSSFVVPTEIKLPLHYPSVRGAGSKGKHWCRKSWSSSPAVCSWVVNLHRAQRATWLSSVLPITSYTTWKHKSFLSCAQHPFGYFMLCFCSLTNCVDFSTEDSCATSVSGVLHPGTLCPCVFAGVKLKHAVAQLVRLIVRLILRKTRKRSLISKQTQSQNVVFSQSLLKYWKSFDKTARKQSLLWIYIYKWLFVGVAIAAGGWPWETQKWQ